MIEIRIYVKLRSGRYTIALYQFGNEKTRSVVEALNELSENPVDVEKILDSWPLGDQGDEKLIPTEEEKDRALVFVRHVQEHLTEGRYESILFPPDAKVICKICKKTIDEIYEDERA